MVWDQPKSKWDLFIKACNVRSIERIKRTIFEVAIHGLQSRVVFKKPEVFKVRRKETKFPKPFQELWMFMAKSTKPLPFPWGDEGDSQDD